MIDITYPDFKSAPPGILRDQDGDLLVKRDIDHAVWLQTSGHWRTLPRAESAWYHGVIGAVAPFRLVAPLPAELTDEALRAAAEGRTAERVEPCPEVGDRVRPEDLARLPVGAVVDTRDGTGAPLIVRGPAGWGWGNECEGERLPDSPQWGDSISSGAMSRQVGDKAVLVGLGLEGARGRAFDEGLAAQGYQPAIDALAGAGAGARPIPRVGDRLRPEDWERLPTGAVVDTCDGGPANLLVRGPRGWGYASVTGGGRPIWEGAIPSEDVARCAGAVLIGLGLDPKRHATEEALREALAAQGYQPAKREAAPAISCERRVGEKVGPDDWSRLPVGAVVDSGDRSRSPFLMRGPRGWGWASARANGLGATLDGNVPSAACATGGFRSARLVALGFEGGGPERLRALLERNGTQVDADGRVVAAPTPAPAPAAAPTPTALRPGDPLSKWTDLPDGGVAVEGDSGVALRVGERRGWPRACGTWGDDIDLPFDLSEEARGVRFVGVVPAPVTIERVRALVEGTPLPSAAPDQPAKREPSAAELCRQARDRRVAALRRALAAAEERLAEAAEVWTVTASGGITRRTAGRRSRPAGVVCSMADMPGGDKAAKRAEARRRVAERDERRTAAEAEVARLRAALYPGPTSGWTFLDAGGARVEVSPTTTATEVAIALGLAGISARASGNVLTVDLEGSLAAGQVSIQTFEA